MNKYVTTEIHGDNRDCPKVQSLEWKRCFGHEMHISPMSMHAAREMRDDMAMAALTGILANDIGGTVQDIANHAYVLADVMMEARKGK